MSSDQVRVDRASIQQATDDTRTNAGRFGGVGEAGDRQHANQLNQMGGTGIGADQVAQSRAGGRHAVEQINGNVNKTAGKIDEHGDEILGRVSKSAAHSLDTYK